MLEMIGPRHKEFLELLIRNKTGLTVENFSGSLGITRNAVRQHLATLETHAMVAKSATRPSGGRPEQLYVLTEKGAGFFPRQYSWFAQLLIETVEQEVGEEQLGERLAAMGEKVAKGLLAGAAPQGDLPAQVRKLAGVMEDIGYKIDRDAPADKEGMPIIEAGNCVFHDLAKKQPHVCRFDLALLSTFTDGKVVHEECMVKGGNVCRFKFTPK
ncbi:MAG TPA: HTH domain-containing protein [Herbaspirillum sp.]|jgi:predicted ArsR family transcriptional regulator